MAALLLPLVCVGQEFAPLLEFGSVWKYDQSGRELGVAWRSFVYPQDFDWSTGQGTFGFDEFPPRYTVYAPLRTPLTVSSSITSYYFRTTFTFAGSVQGLSMVASNLINDGAVIYLNGTEVGRFRVPTGQNAATLAGAPSTGPSLEPLIITNLALLRQGANVVAAEVHQASASQGT